MTLTRWLRSALVPRPASRTRPPAQRLAVERLEDRLTPSTGGVLDPTFGSGGQVISSFSNNWDTASAVTTQSDGKIVIVGGSTASGSNTGGDFLIARYNADGSVDTSFGSGGHTTTDFKGRSDGASAVALQPQTNAPSKILAAGTIISSLTHFNVYNDDFGLARYNANGTLDTTFGTKGKVITDLGGNGDGAYAMAVDGAGRILVAGRSDASGSTTAALVRYTANGALDTSFGSGGKLITNIRVQNYSHGVSFVLQPDGKIALAGTTLDPASSTAEFVVARFNTNGTADVGFGTGGVVTTHPGHNDHLGGVAIQGDGKIVVSGSEDGPSPLALYLLRFNVDGSLDTGFGTGGIVAVQAPDGQVVDAQGSGVAVQADGKIVAGGEFADATGQLINLAALRVNPIDGSVDTGYGTGGWATVPFASADVQAIALQPDGRLLLAGSARPTSTGPRDVVLVRFLGSAPQIGSFTASPNPVSAGSDVTLTASNLSDGNPGSSITQVTFYYFDSSGTKQELGTVTQSSAGAWTLTFTVNLPPGTYTLFAQAKDNYGVFSDPFATTLQVI